MRKTQKRVLDKRKLPAAWCLVVAIFFGLHLSSRCQTFPVVIAEVMYAHQPYDNETVLPESGTAIIASRAANRNFDILPFYGIETPEDAEYPERPLSETVSIQREKIIVEDRLELKERAELSAFIERDSVHLVKMMTYNLHGNHTDYEKHAKVIKDANPDVVAIQEVRGNKNFEILKEKSGYRGNRCFTIGIVHYGIGILWNPDAVGCPINKSYNTVKTDDYWYEKKRAYMVAEFQDFCFISTHYSLNQDGRNKMSRKILENSLAQKCKESGKPLYIAGDMNEGYDDPAVKMLTDNGYEVLNNVERINGTYIDATRQSGSMIDLILEYNINPYHKTIYRGVPMDSIQKVQFFKEGISDHLPYKVKVKIR